MGGRHLGPAIFFPGARARSLRSATFGGGVMQEWLLRHEVYRGGRPWRVSLQDALYFPSWGRERGLSGV